MSEARAVDTDDLSVVQTVGDLSVVTTPQPALLSPTIDGGGDDVARDPDAIAREIEQTRAELADTIDAIANRLNPRKAAARSMQAVTGGGPSGEADPTGSGPTSHAASAGPPVVPLAAIAGVVVIVLLFVRKRRRR